jgi:hypothetical protein
MVALQEMMWALKSPRAGCTSEADKFRSDRFEALPEVTIPEISLHGPRQAAVANLPATVAFLETVLALSMGRSILPSSEDVTPKSLPQHQMRRSFHD